ncbi:unnamed protein product [Rotaria sp. Silwood2]|nr:unnamed protein product [Rotaria sp. Silwood2]
MRKFFRRWRCNRGKYDKLICLCPPSYYRDQCQHQNQRVSLTLQLQAIANFRMVFTIIIMLIDNEGQINSYEYFNYLEIRDCNAFNATSLEYHTSWLYPLESGNEDSYLRLNNLLESISMDDIDKKELFSCLQKMCRSELIDRRVRFKLIDKLDRMFDKQGLQSDDLLLFEQYRLSTLLSSFDSFTELKKQDIQTDENRSILFQKYLLQAQRLIHFESLIQILNNTWSKQQITNMKGFNPSHGLTLKNELILAMIENNSDWEKVLTENAILLDEEV